MGSVRPPSVPQFLVIGAGSRGTAYARAVNKATPGTIAAVAEPDPYKRADFGRRYIWGPNAGGSGSPSAGQEFTGWREYVEWETRRRATTGPDDDDDDDDDDDKTTTSRITGVFICTLDQTHAEIIQALAPLHLHILCEKPMALTLRDCLAITRALAAHPPRIFSVGHVLRYSAHNMLLRRLVCEDRVAGEIVSVEHTEPVGYWHFAHSYVRGNWRHAVGEVGSLLTKSCHDIDFLLWLLCSPSGLTGDKPHLPARLTSQGALTHFRKARKPRGAGGATNCTDCAVERECVYSAPAIYRDMFLREKRETGWPLKIVVPEIEDLVATRGWDGVEARLAQKLAEDYQVGVTRDVRSRAWYGRCVYESDNNVDDDQTVLISWDADEDEDGDAVGRGPKHAVFHMTYPTEAQCERRGKIYGTAAEVSYDSQSIAVFSFRDRSTTVHEVPVQDPEVQKSHGGGDFGLAGAFVDAVKAVDDGAMSVHDAQWKFVGCDLEECVRSHAAVFAAEEAKVRGRVIRWDEWWQLRVVEEIP